MISIWKQPWSQDAQHLSPACYYCRMNMHEEYITAVIRRHEARWVFKVMHFLGADLELEQRRFRRPSHTFTFLSVWLHRKISEPTHFLTSSQYLKDDSIKVSLYVTSKECHWNVKSQHELWNLKQDLRDAYHASASLNRPESSQVWRINESDSIYPQSLTVSQRGDVWEGWITYCTEQ